MFLFMIKGSASWWKLSLPPVHEAVHHKIHKRISLSSLNILCVLFNVRLINSLQPFIGTYWYLLVFRKILAQKRCFVTKHMAKRTNYNIRQILVPYTIDSANLVSFSSPIWPADRYWEKIRTYAWYVRMCA